MPSIKDQSTVEAIAREYCSNGRKKGKALKTIGYSEGYSNTQGIIVVYSNVRVKAAIKLIDAKDEQKCEYTKEEAQRRLDAAYNLAIDDNQASAAVSAVVAANRMRGWDKDNDMGTEKPRDLSDEDLAEANKLGDAAIRLSKTGS